MHTTTLSALQNKGKFRYLEKTTSPYSVWRYRVTPMSYGEYRLSVTKCDSYFTNRTRAIYCSLLHKYNLKNRRLSLRAHDHPSHEANWLKIARQNCHGVTTNRLRNQLKGNFRNHTDLCNLDSRLSLLFLPCRWDLCGLRHQDGIFRLESRTSLSRGMEMNTQREMCILSG